MALANETSGAIGLLSGAGARSSKASGVSFETLLRMGRTISLPRFIDIDVKAMMNSIAHSHKPKARCRSRLNR
jgi:hypothetical protein